MTRTSQCILSLRCRHLIWLLAKGSKTRAYDPSRLFPRSIDIFDSDIFICGFRRTITRLRAGLLSTSATVPRQPPSVHVTNEHARHVHACQTYWTTVSRSRHERRRWKNGKNTAKPARPCVLSAMSWCIAQPWQIRQQESRREEIMVIFVEAAAEIMSKLVLLALRK